MIKKEIWTEIGSRWPRETGYWDDWMRLPNVRHSPQDAVTATLYPADPITRAAAEAHTHSHRRTVGGNRYI